MACTHYDPEIQRAVVDQLPLAPVDLHTECTGVASSGDFASTHMRYNYDTIVLRSPGN